MQKHTRSQEFLPKFKQKLAKSSEIMWRHANSCLQGCSGEADTTWDGFYYCDLKFGKHLFLQKVLKQTGFGPWRWEGVYYCDPFLYGDPCF